MWIEKQDEDLEAIESAKKFDEAFENESKMEWFKDIVSWKNFDENMSNEENFKNAFNNSLNDLIDKSLSNLDEESKKELKIMQSKNHENMSPTEMIESFNEIKELLNTNDWSKAVKTAEHQRQTTEDVKIQNEANTKTQDFREKLIKAIEESKKKESEQKEKAKKEAEERKIAEKNDKQNPEKVLDWWPETPSEKNS